MSRMKRAGPRIISGSKDWPSKAPGSYTTASCKTCSSRFVFEPPLIGPGVAGERQDLPLRAWQILSFKHLFIFNISNDCTSQSSSDISVAVMNIWLKIPFGSDVQRCCRIGQRAQPHCRISAQGAPVACGRGSAGA